MKAFAKVYLPIAALIVMIFIIFGFIRIRAATANLTEQEALRLSKLSTILLDDINMALGHLSSISSEPTINLAFHAPTGKATAIMGDELRTLLSRNSLYDQVCWLSADGIELVRINKTGEINLQIVQLPDLQDKSSLSYFKETLHLEPGQFYISPLDLNVEKGVVEVPHKPTIRAAIRLPNVAGRDQGMFIINLSAQKFLDTIGSESNNESGEYMLLNPAGYLLLAPVGYETFGFMFGHDSTIGKRFPLEWSQIAAKPSGQIMNGNGLFVWNTVNLASLRKSDVRVTENWKLVSFVSSDRLTTVIWQKSWPLLLIAAATLILLAVGVYYYRKLVLNKELFDSLSKKREADERLLLSETQLRLALQGARMGTWEWDLQTYKVCWSDDLWSLYGIEPHSCEPSYNEWLKTVHPDDRKKVDQEVTEAAQNGGQLLVEWRVLHDNGLERWLMSNGTPLRDSDGKAHRYIGVVQDITSLKRAESTLRREEADKREMEVLAKVGVEQRILLDTIQTQIWYLTDPHTLGAVNLAYAEFHGKPKEELEHKNLYEIFPKEAANACEQENIHIYATGEILRTELSLPNASGEERLLAVLKVPKVSADGTVEYVVCSAEDITLRRRAEDKIVEAHRMLAVANVESREMALKAEAANIAKSQFLANMSHEIRTPLNAVIGFSQLMQDSQGLSTEQQKRLVTIERNGEHLLRLINDILEISKIEAGKITVDPTTFDLQILLEELATMFRLKATEKKMCFVAQGVKYVPQYIVADELKLRQVLINLLGNAIKFTKSGEIRLRALTLLAEDETRLLVIQVEDTGMGIAAEEMDLLFDAFEQTRAGHSSGGGTGLGLTISRRFARLMGGDLIATSEFGRGSVFRLEIPLIEGVAAMAAVKSDSRRVLGIEAGCPPCRILVAEDMEDNRDLISQILSSAGFLVQVAVNGMEAVAAFSSQRPHLILMDYRMPGMNGDEAIRQIRLTPGGDAVKIITLTADAIGDARKNILAAGTDDFMTKPLRIGELFEKIRLLTGVAYIYAETVEPHDGSTITRPPSSLSREMLAGIPDQLRKQFYEAAIGCRQSQLLALLQQVTLIDPELSDSLENLVVKMEYEALMFLFK